MHIFRLEINNAQYLRILTVTGDEVHRNFIVVKRKTKPLDSEKMLWINSKNNT